MLHSLVRKLKLAVQNRRVEKASFRRMRRLQANLALDACITCLKATAGRITGISNFSNQTCGDILPLEIPFRGGFGRSRHGSKF